jgi:hypothetical protein
VSGKFDLFQCGADMSAPDPLEQVLCLVIGPRFESLVCRLIEKLDFGDQKLFAALRFLTKAGFDVLKFDVVVANILRGPLVDLRPRLLSYLRPGGRLILSGITVEQVPWSPRVCMGACITIGAIPGHDATKRQLCFPTVQADLVSKEYAPDLATGSMAVEELGGWVVFTGAKKGGK